MNGWLDWDERFGATKVDESIRYANNGDEIKYHVAYN